MKQGENKGIFVREKNKKLAVFSL